MSESIEHYGILGMKWGVRRTPEELGHARLRKAKIANFDKWGRSEETNVLYVTGYSGSGKSTAALSIRKKDDHVIHLDAYTEPLPKNDRDWLQDKSFNRYLDREVSLWKELSKTSSKKLPEYSKEYWDTVDKFSNAIESYGKQEFASNRRVIVEGVQIVSGWLNQNNEFYTSKPIVILNTSRVSSAVRAYDRDDRGNVLDAVQNVFKKHNGQWSGEMNEKITSLTNSTNASVGKSIIDRYLKEYGKRKVSK